MDICGLCLYHLLMRPGLDCVVSKETHLCVCVCVCVVMGLLLILIGGKVTVRALRDRVTLRNKRLCVFHQAAFDLLQIKSEPLLQSGSRNVKTLFKISVCVHVRARVCVCVCV